MTTPSDMLRILTQFIYEEHDRSSERALPDLPELCRRLAPFNIDRRTAEPAYLAGCFKQNLRAAQQQGFESSVDSSLYALGRVAVQRYTLGKVPDHHVDLDTVLYEPDLASLHASAMIAGLLRRVMPDQVGFSSVAEARSSADNWDKYLEVGLAVARGLQTATVLALLSGTSGDRRSLFEMLRYSHVTDLYPDLAQESHLLAAVLFSAHGQNPEGFRERMRRDLEELHFGRYAFLEKFCWLDEQRGIGLGEDTDDEADTVGEIATARLTFTILPDDTGIAGFIAERVRFHAVRPSGARFDADPHRTQVLTRLAEWAGWQRCTLYRGDSITEVRSFGGENITDDYLVLVIDQDSGGQDAVAISPARGRHATFVVRHEVSPLPWHEVFALPKRSSVDLGAKRLRFQSRWPMDEYEAMFQKVTTALACPPTRFGEKFDYSEELGRYLL